MISTAKMNFSLKRKIEAGIAREYGQYISDDEFIPQEHREKVQ